MDVVGALLADRGLTCVVGAGGKKTSLYALARRLDRAVLTATVRIPIFDNEVGSVAVCGDPVSTLAEGPTAWPLGLVPDREGDRYTGYDPATVADIATAHDGPVLVKADGARTREFKAPGDDEPRIPETTDVVVPVASVDAVGEPLAEEHVHRPERVTALTGLERGEIVTPETIGTVLAHPEGGLKGVPAEATVVPLLNKVDDEADEAVARTIAGRVFERVGEGTVGSSGDVTLPRVVCARMIEPTVVAVLERSDGVRAD